jgi:nitrate reductase gamma subunit
VSILRYFIVGGGLAILALSVAGILLAAGGISVILRRLRLQSGRALPSPERGSAD